MPKGQKSQIVTKKHLARQERERRQNRYILISSLTVVILVLLLIGYGIAQQYIIQPNQPVAKVANKSITTKQFQTFARYERLMLIQQYQQYQQYAQLFGDQTSSSYFGQYMAQIEYQLQPTVVGQDALDYLIANQIIEQEAAKRGITVTDEEVDQRLQEYFGYFPNGTPTTAPTSIAVPTSTLNPTQLALVTATFTPSPTVTITPTPVITVTQQITTPTATAVITPTQLATTGTPYPTSTPYTLTSYEQDLKTYMGNINTYAELDEADFRWVFRMQVLRTKVMDAINADLSREQDQVWARRIVLTDEAQAKSIYERLKSGADFEAVAIEVYSGTQSTPIDMGWFGVGSLEKDTATVVFNLNIGQISEPILTSNGWEIYQVLGHEVRTLTDSEFEQLKQTKFEDWITQQRTAQNVQTFDVWKTRVPVRPTIPPTQATQ